MPDLTPMFRQYHRIKRAHQDCLLLFRMGDFYEMFFDDAVRAARTLDITLTTRGRGTAVEAPMCGVPFHAAEAYIARLVRRGFRVAICDQVEDPKQARGIVRREVTRVVSPGTVSAAEQLEASVPNYLCGLLRDGDGFGVAFADLTTGDFRVAEHRGAAARDELEAQLCAFSPAEVLIPEGSELRGCLPAAVRDRTLVHERSEWGFAPDRARQGLTEQFRVAGLEGFGLEAHPLAVRAAGAALEYLRESQKRGLPHLRPPRLLRRGDCLVLDPATLRNLEVTATLQEGKRQGSLLDHMDSTCTGPGGRRLRDWLLRPLVDRAAIEARLDGVEELLARAELRGQLRDRLRRIQDLERLLARAALGTATVREVAGIRETLRRLPAMRDAAAEGRAALLADCRDGIDTLEDLRARLDGALVEDPPPVLKDGDVIRPGYDTGLDELRALRSSGRDYLARLETRERQRTGIPSLKVRYNRVFGYYLEVSRPNLHLVPAEYSRKQTMTNAERFTLPELKEYEEKVLTAEERIAALESEIFGSLRQEIAARGERLLRTADALAVLDVLAALAETAERHRYCRPRIREDRCLRIAGGRHPVLEATCEPAGFQANDTGIDPETAQILILTGPNMGGKSTYLRQVALITLLAQAGSFVPADAAEIGVVDRIFSRIGASDNLRLGHSTFLSEMLEVANILNNATDRSLILLDEVGRGTSTFDGLSLAWAVVEHLHEEAGLAAKTLFATHYHELTALAESLPRVRNLTMAVREGEDGILFLHQVVAGSSDRSYGIHVARLAGVPAPVIRRAEVVLRRLESQAIRAGGRGRRTGADAPPGPAQLPLALETDPERPLRRALRAIEPERITPLEAIRILADLREKAED